MTSDEILEIQDMLDRLKEYIGDLEAKKQTPEQIAFALKADVFRISKIIKKYIS